MNKEGKITLESLQTVDISKLDSGAKGLYLGVIQLINERDIANKKLDKIKNHVQTQQSIIKRQPSADRSIDDYILARLDTILSIIGGNDE